MEAEAALRFVDELLSQQGKQLTDLQGIVFLGTWNGKSYKVIHQDCKERCSLDHLKRNVGYELWQILSEALGEKVLMKTLQRCVTRAWQKHQAQMADQAQMASETHPQNSDPARSPLDPVSSNGRLPDYGAGASPTPTVDWLPLNSQACEDWGDARPAHPFYGYAHLLNRLNDAVRVSLCRLVSLYGISGVGKSAIAFQLARHVRDQFEFVIWRSLKQAPLLPDLLAELTHHFSCHRERNGELNRFMQYMTEHRCLVILDGFETVLGSGVHDGSYRAGYEPYGDLLHQIKMTAHESCLIITGWENPKEIEEGEGNHGYVCSEIIKGLSASGTKDLLMDKRCLGTEYQWREITHRYWGHPLILSAIATDIREICRGDTAQFLEQFSDPLIPEAMLFQLDRQLARLSATEQSIIRYLETTGNPVTFVELQQALGQEIPILELMKVLRSLKRRTLLESTTSSDYALQSLVMEYLRKSRQSVS